MTPFLSYITLIIMLAYMLTETDNAFKYLPYFLPGSFMQLEVFKSSYDLVLAFFIFPIKFRLK